MALWQLMPLENGSWMTGPWSEAYDRVFGFVVRAETEQEARLLADAKGEFENHAVKGVRPWLSKKYSSCTQIAPEGERVVILRREI